MPSRGRKKNLKKLKIASRGYFCACLKRIFLEGLLKITSEKMWGRNQPQKILRAGPWWLGVLNWPRNKTCEDRKCENWPSTLSCTFAWALENFPWALSWESSWGPSSALYIDKASTFVGISVDIFVYTPVCIFVSTFVRSLRNDNKISRQ